MQRLAPIFGLPAGSRVPLALECDDLSLLKKVAMRTDTVLVSPLAGAHEEVADQRLVRIAVAALPVLGSNLGVVALRDRSFSPLASHVVNWLQQTGSAPA